MMRRQFVLCCALAVLGLAMNAASVKADQLKPVKGEIASIAEDGTSFVLKAGDDEVTVKVTESTKYMVDGKESAKGDALKVGAKAQVTHEEGTASKVEIATK